MKTLDALKLLDEETKAEVYLVGGYVRDLLLGLEPNDIDGVVRKMPVKNIIGFLSKYGSVKTVELSKAANKFELPMILFKAKGDTMVAQLALPKRGKKQIQESNNTLEQDSQHRDFSINALYLPVNYKSLDEVIDHVDGRVMIEAKRIMTVGDPMERFKESPIRILRAVSLAAKTGFTISDMVQIYIRHALKQGVLNHVPKENIRDELNKIIMSKKPSRYFNMLLRLGILREVLPEVSHCANVEQDPRHHKYDVFTHLVKTLDYSDKNLVLRWAGLMHDVGKVEARKEVGRGKKKKVTFHRHEMVSVKLTKEALKRLCFPNSFIGEVVHLVRHHMYHYTREFTDAGVRKCIKRFGITAEDLDDLSNFPLFKLRQAERLGNGLKKEPITGRQKDFERRIKRVFHESKGLNLKDLDINGDIIISIFRIPQGAEIGDILNHLLEKVLEDPSVNERSKLLALVADYVANRMG